VSRRGKAEHLGAKYARVVGTVAHLELCHGRLGWDRPASGPVVISLGGQYPLRGLTAPARILLQPVNLYKQCRGGASWGGHRARPVPSNRKRCLPGPQHLTDVGPGPEQRANPLHRTPPPPVRGAQSVGRALAALALAASSRPVLVSS
jgi:hypothetical protein